MKEIKLTQGKFAIVDDEDYNYLSRFNWNLSSTASGSERALHAIRVGDKVVYIPMERFILGSPSENSQSKQYIHLNNDNLDNRKENIRLTDIGIRVHHSVKMGTNSGKKYSSKYKGVCQSQKDKGLNRWRAYISDSNQKDLRGNKLQIKIGSFETENGAALTYNKKAIELYGEHAYQNIII